MLQQEIFGASEQAVESWNEKERQCYPTELFGDLSQCRNVRELQKLNDVYNDVFWQPWEVVDLPLSKSHYILQNICTKHLLYIICTPDAGM